MRYRGRIRGPSGRPSWGLILSVFAFVSVVGFAIAQPAIGNFNRISSDQSADDGGKVPIPAPTASTRIGQSATTVGVSDSDRLLVASDADLEKLLTAVQQMGATTVRISITWAYVERVQNVYDWAPVDRIVNSALKHKLSPLGIIAYSPAWAAAPGATGLPARPASAAQYGAFAGKVASRYQGKMAAYEIWNEPNLNIYFKPAPDPAGYTGLLKAAYPAIKAADPGALVVGGVLAGGAVDSPTSMSPPNFVSGMYKAGARGYFDALSFHPYGHAPFDDATVTENSSTRQIIEVRKLMVDNGDTNKQIWGTEYGQPSSKVPDETIGAMMANIIIKWRELPYAGPLYLFEISDRQTGSTDPELTFGLLRSDLTPKASYLATKTLLSTGVPITDEARRFIGQATVPLGEVRSPVYHLGASYRQEHANGTLYETPTGFISVPPAIAARVRSYPGVPISQFANGSQAFSHPSFGYRVFTSSRGTFVVYGAILSAYTPDLGFPLTEVVTDSAGNAVSEFEHGRISWSPSSGTKVERYPQTTTPPVTPTTTPPVNTGPRNPFGS